MKKARIFAAALIVAALGISTSALATPTQEEVFRSINQNVGSSVDLSKLVPYLLVAIALAIMLGLYNYHRKKRGTTNKRLNNPAKLSREICRRINIRPAEFRQLKLLADEQEVQQPLTLILCPSLLGKAIRTQNARVDRALVKGIVGRLKESLSHHDE
jgi:hypothetical protein